MQALLSFEQAPPIAAPFRFFLTAPLFAILAGTLLLWSGPELLASRWTPSALALTHLITVGFMLQVMLGAMIQILPVVAGANMARPLLLSSLVHAAIVPGALLLTAGLLTSQPFVLRLAVLLLGIGIALFLGAAGHALVGVRSTNPTIQGLKLALIGLAVTAGLGMLLAVARDGSSGLPVLQLTAIHLGWGLVGWGGILLAAVALVVVPMFQITPPFPGWFAHGFSWSVLAVLSSWSIVVGAGWQRCIGSPGCCSRADGGGVCGPDPAGPAPQQARPVRRQPALLAPGDAVRCWPPAPCGLLPTACRRSLNGRNGRCCAVSWLCSAASCR
jgi:hypothetical protein